MNNQPDERLLPLTDCLIDIARDEYKFFSLYFRNRQTAIQNIYFWIASILFTVYAAAFQGVFFDTGYLHLEIAQITPEILPKILVALAFALCAWVILTGIDAMRGRKNTRHFLGAYTAASLLKDYTNAKNLTNIDAMIDLLQICQKNIDANAMECERMGKHLRNNSIALVIAVVCGLFAFLF